MTKFKKGELIKILLTGKIGMILEVYDGTIKEIGNDDVVIALIKGYETGYQVRLPDYSIKRFFEFELTKRKG